MKIAFGKINIRLCLAFLLLIFILIFVLAFCYLEYKIRPLIGDAAASRGRSYATELISSAVESTSAFSAPLVSVSKGSDGVYGIETDVKALSAIRAEATSAILNRLSDEKIMRFFVPLGSLVGSNLIAGRGSNVEIRLVPVGDITTDIKTEFITAGINQTLHKIVLRVRVSFDILAAGESLRVDVLSDIGLAETVIVGKVPDAYTSINRYELDEDEENDLNDYAATLP